MVCVLIPNDLVQNTTFCASTLALNKVITDTYQHVSNIEENTYTVQV